MFLDDGYKIDRTGSFSGVGGSCDEAREVGDEKKAYGKVQIRICSCWLPEVKYYPRTSALVTAVTNCS